MLRKSHTRREAHTRGPTAMHNSLKHGFEKPVKVTVKETMAPSHSDGESSDSQLGMDALRESKRHICLTIFTERLSCGTRFPFFSDTANVFR